MKLLPITAVIATLLTGIFTLPAAQAFTLESLPDLSGSGLNYEVRNGAATLYGKVHRDNDQLLPEYGFDTDNASGDLAERKYNQGSVLQVFH